MSHYSVLVFGDNVDKLLHPYDESLEIEKGIDGDGDFNPKAKWDWYKVGGRWKDFFLLRNGTRADSACLVDVDWLGMQEVNAEKARKHYRKIKALCKGEIPELKITWEAITSSIPDVDVAREAYHAQTPIKQWKNYLSKSEYSFENLEDFQVDESKYVGDAFDSLNIFAVVTEKGEWLEQGEMGWWASVSNAKSQFDWNAEIQKIIQNARPTVKVTLVDCHI